MRADDISVGAFVTVLSWPTREVPVYSGPFDYVGTGTRTQEDHSYVGEVLRVVSVALPFVVVDRVGSNLVPRVTLDTRRAELQALPMEFVLADRVAGPVVAEERRAA